MKFVKDEKVLFEHYQQRIKPFATNLNELDKDLLDTLSKTSYLKWDQYFGRLNNKLTDKEDS
jgi:hypothetical protein